MAIYLKDFTDEDNYEELGGFHEFLKLDKVSTLRWPEAVVEQWLWEHGGNGHFVADYGNVDLERIRWTCDEVQSVDLAIMPTGVKDGNVLETNAQDHAYFLSARGKFYPEIVQEWDTNGTWLVPPLLIDRSLLQPPATGLQIVEGRTRVGILRGRLQNMLNVAEYHLTWVGRPMV